MNKIFQPVIAAAMCAIALNMTITNIQAVTARVDKVAKTTSEVVQVVGRVAIRNSAHSNGFLVRAGSGELRIVHYDDGSMFGRGFQPEFLLEEITEGATPVYLPVASTQQISR